MFRKGIIACVFAGMVAALPLAADVVVRIAPPRVIVEHPVRAPGPGYVWTPGYHRWDGGRYVWVGGSWVRPPHPHARWERAHWVHRGGGYVFVEGRWR